MVPVVDLSHHQGEVDFRRLKALGVAAVVLRVGDGGYNDRMFERYVDGAGAAGLPHLLYVFCRTNRSAGPHVEALHRAEQRGRSLAWFLDLEDDSGRTPEQVLAFVNDAVALATFEHESGIYTGDSWWRARIPGHAWSNFNDLMLWQARYPWGRTPAPTNPRPDPDDLPNDWEDWAMRKAPAPVRGWDRWSMWQFSSAGPGRFYGVSSDGLDLNLMRDDVWLRLTGRAPDTIPVLSPGSFPPEEANMVIRVPNGVPVNGRWPFWRCTGEHVISMNGAPLLQGMGDEWLYGVIPAVRLPAGHARVCGVSEMPANMGGGVIVHAEDGGTFAYPVKQG